jgi:manganese/iron transport system ATP-binding protein
MTDKELIPQPENAWLELEHVDAGYNGSLALEDLSFHIPQGVRVALVGPNGAGKSTLFKVLARLIPLRKGEIRIHGLPLGHHCDCLAYVPQKEEVDWQFPVSVKDVILMGRYGKNKWLGRMNKKDNDVAMRSMAQMGMSELADSPIADLSGGQQQRVFLARALTQEPHILLMDEPFNGVDMTSQEKLFDILDDLRNKCVTTIVATHDLNLAMKKFDLVILLNHRLIAIGPPSEVMRRETIRQAYGSQALDLGEMIVVDECCPGEKNDG